jgi:hypothetical protein
MKHSKGMKQSKAAWIASLALAMTCEKAMRHA